MLRSARLTTMVWILAFAALVLMIPHSSLAASAEEISQNARNSLQILYNKSSSAETLAPKAKGILVFPAITKAGLLVGGQYGEGALMKGGKVIAYYKTVAGSFGLQAGVQKYGYALFFMTDAALDYLDRSDGWELGTGPSIVIVDKGAAGGISTTTAKSDIYAFFFDQKGLMAGIGLQGTKVTRIEK